MSGFEELVLPAAPESAAPSWRWGTVTAVGPLRVQLDGDPGAMPITPGSVSGALAVSDRVWCQIVGRQIVVAGRAGGQHPVYVENLSTTGEASAASVATNVYKFPVNSTKIEASTGTHIGFLTYAGNAAPVKVGSLVISDSYLDTAPTNGLYVKGASQFVDRVNMDAQPYSVGMYNATSTFTANVGIATSPNGALYRLTSSRRYKSAIWPEDVPDSAIRALQPKSYVDKKQGTGADGQPNPQAPRYLGLIAEEVADIPGLRQLLVTFDTIQGLGRVPDAVSYDRVGVALIPVIKRLLDRVDALEARVTALGG